MILIAVSVYDSKAKTYFHPFFVPSVGVAIRGFGDEANKLDGPIGRHPGDYQLYEVGSFNEHDATFTTTIPMKLLANAAEFVDLNKRVHQQFDGNTYKLHNELEVANGSEKA